LDLEVFGNIQARKTLFNLKVFNGIFEDEELMKVF
jgi:hypothetical protein